MPDDRNVRTGPPSQFNLCRIGETLTLSMNMTFARSLLSMIEDVDDTDNAEFAMRQQLRHLVETNRPRPPLQRQYVNR